jgi:hypothetical protein
MRDRQRTTNKREITMKQLVFAMALMLMLVGSAAAQRGAGDINVAQGTNTLFINKLEGVETFSGIVDTEDNIIWGNTYAVRNETATLTISFNRMMNIFSSDRDNIVSGSWTMAVYKNGEYAGTLYGDVISGRAQQLDPNDVLNGGNGSITAKLRIKGGTDNYANATSGEAAAGTYTGYLFTDGNGKPKVEGSVDLVF